MKIFLFTYEAISHPIKNISIWFVVLVAFVIHGNIVIEFKGKEMFLMSVGLVSIMTFISNFLEKQTINIENKDNFYLGYNIKKLKFHDNFWLKKFNDLPVRLLFWIIAILPIIVICSELKYKSKVLNELFDNRVVNIEYIGSIWLAVFIVILFYCTALLIESVALSSKSFSRSYLYDATSIYEKRKIKLETEKYFERVFNNIFNVKYIIGIDDDFYTDAERIISYIINRGHEVSASDVENIEFLEIAFGCERDKINKLIEKACRCEKSDKSKKIMYLIDTFLIMKNTIKI